MGDDRGVRREYPKEDDRGVREVPLRKAIGVSGEYPKEDDRGAWRESPKEGARGVRRESPLKRDRGLRGPLRRAIWVSRGCKEAIELSACEKPWWIYGGLEMMGYAGPGGRRERGEAGGGGENPENQLDVAVGTEPWPRGPRGLVA